MDDRRSPARSDALIDLIYDAATEPPVWQQVADRLSEALGGAPVSLWLSFPYSGTSPMSFRAAMDPALNPVFERYYTSGQLPWGSTVRPEAAAGFTLLEGFMTADEIARTDFYREFMKPQDIAPATPLMHVFAHRELRPLAAIAIHQRATSPRMGEVEIEFGNRLVPHLRRAYAIHVKMRVMERNQWVLSEVVDRLPAGIILLDTQGRVLLSNRGAQRIAASQRGLRIVDDRVVATEPKQDRELQALIGRAIIPRSDSSLDFADVLMIDSGTRNDPLPLLVAPLKIPLVRSLDAQAAAAIFLGEPPIMRPSARQILRSLYDLTEAEADLALSIAEGLTVEEIAEQRGVKVSTARSQLKRAFAKTGTKRQSDLVRIILGGVAPLPSR